jgi:hypothetical protein
VLASRLGLVVYAGWLVLASCSGDPPRQPTPIAHHVVPPVPEPRCVGTLKMKRVTLERGRDTELAWDLRATYRGSSEDVFADGTTATMLHLELAGGKQWLPDVRDTALHRVGEHCMRVVTSSQDRVELELDVTKRPGAEMRCEFSCCVTPEQRKPAPGGEIECCMCPDDP